MSEPKVDVAPDNRTELRILTTGATSRVTITDKKGVEHVLQPLDLSDLCEYEDKVGASILGGSLQNIKLRDIAYLLYLSLRKDGCTDDEIYARRFRMTESQVARLFDFSFIAKSGEVFLDLLRISGLDLNPTQPAGEKAKTPAVETAKAST